MEPQLTQFTVYRVVQIVCTVQSGEVEWDPNKAGDNFRKHGVQFSTEAEVVFSDDFAITITDDESDPSERRFVAIGMGAKVRVLVVVYIYRGDYIRIVSGGTAGTT